MPILGFDLSLSTYVVIWHKFCRAQMVTKEKPPTENDILDYGRKSAMKNVKSTVLMQQFSCLKKAFHLLYGVSIDHMKSQLLEIHRQVKQEL